MKPVAKTIKTPVGVFPAPSNPHFIADLETCNTEEDLFRLVEPNGFINPDALNEVDARGLYTKYCEWIKSSKKL